MARAADARTRERGERGALERVLVTAAVLWSRLALMRSCRMLGDDSAGEALLVRSLRISILFLALALNAGCGGGEREPARLPTGAVLDPVGEAVPLGSMPVAMLFAPDSTKVVAVLSGYREQGAQVIDLASRRVVQTLVQGAAFLGATFTPDGHTLFVSGGNRDVVYAYAWGDSATLADSIAFAPPPDSNGGRVYPSGLACSADGSRLYVAGNLSDSLYVVDVATRRVAQRLSCGRYPYGVIADREGRVFVSDWGAASVATFAPGPRGLVAGPRIEVGRHPSAMVLDATGARLYVTSAASDRIAVVDTRAGTLLVSLEDSAPGTAVFEGGTPNALALSPDGRRLYVAEADNNAVAVFALGHATGAPPTASDSLVGRIPVEWYPTAVLARGDSLWVLNGKGHGTGPNPGLGHPGRTSKKAREYTLGQTSGSLSCLASPADPELPALSRRVATANHWDMGAKPPTLPPFRHVVYIIRENRTFDQVFGDVAGADGDTSLTFFPRAVTPNAHALAERFGVFDRFFVNAEVSADGHNWTTAAYASDYVEKTVPSVYSNRGRAYDYDGTNRGKVADDDVNAPSTGYIWDLAERARVTLRNYGEFTMQLPNGRWAATKPWLAAHTDSEYAGWDLDLPDTRRAERWLAEFDRQVAGDSMPALTVMWLPNDHTAGAAAGKPTPRAYVAVNDLALGRIVEAISRSRYWSSTIVFVLEDDAQDGPDHVDSHRSPLLVISPYNRRGVVHRFANTTDVIATIDRILHLGALSQFDAFGRPITSIFGATADTTPYTALTPQVSMTETNPSGTTAARLSRELDLSGEDRADEERFNRVLWLAVKGEARPYPKRRAAPAALLMTVR